MISVIVPVYRNAENISSLLDALQDVNRKLTGELEAIFVVDGSPDDSYALLAAALPATDLRAQLILLSRNFGSFSAIRAGMAAARGARLAVIAADLQEPPELLLEFDQRLRSGDCEVLVGLRTHRHDPLLSRMASSLFWAFYRRYIQKEIPPGGVDVFACTPRVRDLILQMQEANSSLIALLFWVGFKRALVPYVRRPRLLGKSAWTFKKRLNYLFDSVFSFTDLPIKVLFRLGMFGLFSSVVGAAVILASRLLVGVAVPGYAATALIIIFFGGLNSLGLGIIGGYVWRTFENTKQRPNYIVASHVKFRDDGK
jgi:polyisoprenyl-phosphate glycosyltransferase